MRVDVGLKTVVIKRSEKSLENISRNRVALAPKSDEDSHSEKEMLPIPIRYIIRNYPAEEETDLNYVTSIPSTPKQTETNPPDRSKGTPEPEIHEQTTSNHTPTKSKNHELDNDHKNDKDDAEDIFMGKIVIDRTNKSKEHKYASVGELLYRIRWYDYRPFQDTW